MGGTLLRLVSQGHDVVLAYQTSGSIAVSDDETVRFLDFAQELVAMFGKNQPEVIKCLYSAFYTCTVNKPKSRNVAGINRKVCLLRISAILYWAVCLFL